MKIKVSGKVFNLALAGSAIYLAVKLINLVTQLLPSGIQGLYYQTQNILNEFNGFLDPTAFRVGLYFGILFGFIFSVGYILLFMFFVNSGRKKPIPGVIFIVYLILNAIGALTGLSSVLATINILYSYGAGLSGFIALILVLAGIVSNGLLIASCAMFLSDMSKLKKEQQIEMLRSFYTPKSAPAEPVSEPAPVMPVIEAVPVYETAVEKEEARPDTAPETAQEDEKVFCAKCGVQAKPFMNYCVKCGAPLKEE